MSAQGLENKMNVVVAELNQARQHPFDSLNKRWRPTTLGGYLAERNLRKEHLYAGLGVDAHLTTVNDLFNHPDPNAKYLLNEIIYDAMLKAQGLSRHAEANLAPQTSFNDNTNAVHRALTPEFIRPFLETYSIEQAFYQDLVAGQVPAPQDTVSAPYLDFSPIAETDVAEGGTIETSNFTVSRKDVKCQKVSTGIEVTYETIQSSTLAVVSTFFMAFGKLHAAKKNGKLMTVIVSGNPSSGDSAAVIGCDVANTLANKDVFRIRQRMGLCGWNPRVVVAAEEVGLDYLSLPAVQSKQFTGMALLPTDIRIGGVYGQSAYYPSFDLAANRILFHDPSVAVMEYVFMAFMIETEKIISKQIQAAYASENQCFVKQIRQASVLLAKDLALAGNNFPAWMKPIRAQ